MKPQKDTGSTQKSSLRFYAVRQRRQPVKLTRLRFDPECIRPGEYDQVGRLKQAYSGAQARGGTTNDGPYLQSQGYDA